MWVILGTGYSDSLLRFIAKLWCSKISTQDLHVEFTGPHKLVQQDQEFQWKILKKNTQLFQIKIVGNVWHEEYAIVWNDEFVEVSQTFLIQQAQADIKWVILGKGYNKHMAQEMA